MNHTDKLQLLRRIAAFVLVIWIVISTAIPEAEVFDVHLNNLERMLTPIGQVSFYAMIALLILVCIQGAIVKKPLLIIGVMVMYGLWAVGGFIPMGFPNPIAVRYYLVAEIIYPVGVFLLSIDAFIDKQKKLGAIAVIAAALTALFIPAQGLIIFSSPVQTPFVIVFIFSFLPENLFSLGMILAGIFLFIRDPKRRETAESPKNVLMAVA